MDKHLQDEFKKSLSRYEFSINQIEEKYCRRLDKRQLAVDTLNRNFGEAFVSSPYLELDNVHDKLVCQRLNDEFENQFGKRRKMDASDQSAAKNVSRMKKKHIVRKEQPLSLHDHSVNFVHSRNIDVIMTPVRDGPLTVYSQYDPEAHSKLFNRKQHRSNQFHVALDEIFMDAWFQNASGYWNNGNFTKDHTFRCRLANNVLNSVRFNSNA